MNNAAVKCVGKIKLLLPERLLCTRGWVHNGPVYQPVSEQPKHNNTSMLWLLRAAARGTSGGPKSLKSRNQSPWNTTLWVCWRFTINPLSQDIKAAKRMICLVVNALSNVLGNKCCLPVKCSMSGAAWQPTCLCRNQRSIVLVKMMETNNKSI